MRDLASRLREVVRRERDEAAARGAGGGGRTASGASPVRELTYVPEPDAARGASGADQALGGRAVDPEGSCVAIDKCYPADQSHGRRPVDAYTPAQGAPLHLFDPRLSGDLEWWRHVLFFDIETTGLSGGAGTLAFVAGCGWFGPDGFTVRQDFLAAPGGEHAMLDELAGLFAGASLLVTYNGRSFDVPLMEARWAFHRRPAPTCDLPHFDMLPAARRLWGRRDHDRPAGRARSPLTAPSASDESCRLSALERTVLGFHRVDDVPGFEIPARYFHFLRTGDPSAVEPVLEHNRHDLMSLAAVMSHALWLAREGPDACREPAEQLAIGRIYERAGQIDAARRAFDRAACLGEAGVRRHALARLALLLRREQRHEEAAVRWKSVLEMAGGELSALERRAAEALAIHHEHRAKDPIAARRYAALLSAGAARSASGGVQHRLNRLDRKIEARKIDRPEEVGRLLEMQGEPKAAEGEGD